EREGALQLSFAQQRLWFLNKFEAASPHYNIAAAVKFKGQLDIPALERSLTEITQRHEILRTTFAMNGEEPVQQITEPGTVRLPMMDLQAVKQREEEAQALLTAAARRVFDLESGPLLRVMLLRLDTTEHILMVTMHHIISDGWSMGVLIRELTALYNSFSSDAALVLPDLPVQYADFAHWQRQWLQGDVREESLNYWRQQLAGMSPVLQLRTDYPQPEVQTFRGARVSFQLDHQLTESLNAVSRAHDVTLFMTLLATLSVLLMRYTRETDISIGTPVAGRTLAETEGLIGFFVNTLVLRTDLSGDPTYAQLLQRTRELCLSAYQHQELPFEQLLDAVRPGRELNRTPLFQVMLVLHNSPLPQIELDGLQVEAIEVETGTSKIETTFTFREESSGILSGTIDYQTDLFSRETVEQLAANYVRLLQSAVADPQRRIAALDLFDERGCRQLLEQFNQTTHEYPETCVHRLLEAQVERTPEATAVVCGDRHITYAELNMAADRVADQLLSRGVGAEALVGVMMERSIELVIALFVILKAGAAYVPLDPSYPEERLAFILADAQVHFVLTQRELQESLTGLDVEAICVDELVGTDCPALKCDVTADNLAYLIYTSGSTGTPKGVMVTHRAIC
ncbi:MAG TPA: condensation domain-containing protein, partial [Pyrinomonadaceae bacterium]|nr:condensation domain-containing protein [Pyrinomonadaceae bacterium]